MSEIKWSKSFKNVSNSKCGRFVVYPQTARYGLDDNGRKVSVARTQKELKCVAARLNKIQEVEGNYQEIDGERVFIVDK